MQILTFLFLLIVTGISVHAQSNPPMPRGQFKLSTPSPGIRAPFSSGTAGSAVRARWGIGGVVITPEIPGIVCKSGRGPMAVGRVDLNYSLEGDIEARPKLYPLSLNPPVADARPGQHLLSSYSVFDGLEICMIAQIIPIPVLPINKPYGIE